MPVEPTTLNTVEPDPITSRACAPEAEMIVDPVILAVPVNGKASPPPTPVKPEPSPWNEPEKFGADAVFLNSISPVTKEPDIKLNDPDPIIKLLSTWALPDAASGPITIL